MANSLTIRELNVDSEEEKAAVISLVNECYRGNKNWTSEGKLVRGERTNSRKLARDLERMTVLLAVVSSEDRSEKIIGCIKTGIVNRTAVGPLTIPAGYVGLFAVHPDSGGKGVGTKLLAAAEIFCSTRGASAVVMDVLDSREDIMAWYRRKGFEALHSMSIPARGIIEGAGEELLIDCNFIRMRKSISGNEV